MFKRIKKLKRSTEINLLNARIEHMKDIYDELWFDMRLLNMEIESMAIHIKATTIASCTWYLIYMTPVQRPVRATVKTALRQRRIRPPRRRFQTS